MTLNSKAERAQEFSESLGLIADGFWRQLAWAVESDVPKDMGLSVPEWIDRYRPPVQLEPAHRKAAAQELKESNPSLSNRAIAAILNVSAPTIAADLAPPEPEKPQVSEPEPVKNFTPEPEKPQVSEPEPVKNFTPEPEKPQQESPAPKTTFADLLPPDPPPGGHQDPGTLALIGKQSLTALVEACGVLRDRLAKFSDKATDCLTRVPDLPESERLWLQAAVSGLDEAWKEAELVRGRIGDYLEQGTTGLDFPE